MRIVSVDPQSPAVHGELREGDIVVGIERVAIDSVDALHQKLGEALIQKDCSIKFLRGHASPQVMFSTVRPTQRQG